MCKKHNSFFYHRDYNKLLFVTLQKDLVMKIKLTASLGTAFIFLFALACKTTNKTYSKSKSIELKTFYDSVSYIIGSDVAQNMKKNEIPINKEIFLYAFSNALDSKDTLIPKQERMKIMNKLQKELTVKQQTKNHEELEKNKIAGEAFLKENKKNQGVVELPSGLQYKVLVQGSGTKPGPDDEVTVHYEGRLIDGTIFDSSYERGEPINFPLKGVIKGWTEGLQLMNTGSVYELYIPSDLAYGDRAIGQIPAGSTLIFKVELISVNKK